MIVRHPAVTDTRNAKNRARWVERYFGGQHFPDLRDGEMYRLGEWIALQVSWLLRGYRVLRRETQLKIQRAKGLRE